MSLDLPKDEFAAAAAEIAAMLIERRDGRYDAPVLDHPDPAGLVALLREPVPREGTSLPDLLREVRERIAPHGRRNDSPRFFGYVCSGGSDSGTLADFLASGLNQNVTSWRSSAAATEIERLVLDWIRRITGMPEGSEGLLLGGGSMANLSALAVARNAVAGADVGRGGLLTLGREMTLYASEEVHMSVPRAASLLGLGSDALRRLPTDAGYRLDVEALAEAVAADRAEGRLPFCVVANAGSTNTGAVDPLEAIAALCAREGLWLHVDGAWGGFAALAPSMRGTLSGLALADSLAIDPHKWLHVPFDCGALLVRDAAALRAPFSEVGEYARTQESGERSSFTFFEQGPELSRRFRALKVWMVLRHLGTDALGAYIEHDLAMARRLAETIEAAEDLELLAPAPMSAVCFRFAPPGRSEGEIEALNRQILAELQREAIVYPTNAVLKGRFAIRACILNPRTGPGDVDRLVAEVRAHGRRLSG